MCSPTRSLAASANRPLTREAPGIAFAFVASPAAVAAAAPTLSAAAPAPETIDDPKVVRDARAVPPAAAATKGIARREVTATAGPVTQRIGQVADQPL
ncbi:hypothetical protein OF846_001013 [Rhodotorula toruloides]|nr:hypothetical protein OF846_001013 [Rhodotorula toruloides]